MGDYSKAKHVAFLIINCLFIAIYNLWGHVTKSSTFLKIFSNTLFIQIYRKAKIDDFDT